VSFSVLFACKCVLYYCHRVATQLQLTNVSYQFHIIPVPGLDSWMKHNFFFPSRLAHNDSGVHKPSVQQLKEERSWRSPDLWSVLVLRVRTGVARRPHLQVFAVCCSI